MYNKVKNISGTSEKRNRCLLSSISGDQKSEISFKALKSKYKLTYIHS